MLQINIKLTWGRGIASICHDRCPLVVIEPNPCLLELHACFIACLICPLFPIAQLKILGTSSWRAISSRRSKQYKRSFLSAAEWKKEKSSSKKSLNRRKSLIFFLTNLFPPNLFWLIWKHRCYSNGRPLVLNDNIAQFN